MNDKPAKKEILRFLRAYIKWVESGAGDHPKFTTKGGLCRNCCEYYEWELNYNTEVTFRRMLNLQNYPFNNDRGLDYIKECWAGTCHLNHKRLVWVYTTITQLKRELKNG